MKIPVRPGLKLALVMFSVLVVYFQSIYHPLSLFDDPFIVEHYGVNSTLSFFDVITPGKGFYYRPLVDLSYWLDFQLWGMDSTFMHLENVAVHLINVFLVFLIASRLPLSAESKIFPCVSALLFGLHPINSESVNWIAGRTDVFAGVFVFFAIYCLIRSVQEQSKRFAMLAFGVAFVGMLTKETAIMFLPSALLVSLYWPVSKQDVHRYKIWRTRFLLTPIFISSSLAFSLLILVYFKGHAGNALSSLFDGSTYDFRRPLEAFGFYVKKFFLPLPLNTAIVEISPLYAIVGIITLCIFVFTFRRAGIIWILFAVSALFILPALLVAVKPIAWTPFGERYLYISSAFAVIACVDACYRFFVQRNAVMLFVPIVIVIIALSSIMTFRRGMLWGDNFALLEDIIAKSPSFGIARNVYVGLLGQEGRYAEAEEQLRIVLLQDNSENVKKRIKLNLVSSKIIGKPLDEARKILLSEISSKAAASVELLTQLNRIEEGLLNRSVSLKDKKIKAADIVETNEILMIKTGDPFHLYRSGQIMLLVHDKQAAAVYFRRAYNDPRLKEYYREPARRLAEKLEEQ